jgi:cell division septum initiation protein DivIVA
VYKVTDKSSIVLKSDYENLLKENIALKEKVEKEREEKFRYQKERDSFEAKVIELSTIASDKPKDTLNLHGENPNDKQELQEINSNLQKLVEFNSHPELRDVITSIDNGWGVPNKSEVIQRMINRGLVKEIEMFNLTEKQREQLIKSQVKFLTFTRLGQKVAEAYKKKYD